MPLTEQQYKDLLLVECGDTADGLLAANLATLWTKRDTVTDLYGHYLAVKLDAIDLLLGAAARDVTFRGLDGVSVNLSDVFDHLMRLREAASSELASSAAGGGAAGVGGAISELAQTAPIMREGRGQADPNARAKRGDPLKGCL